LRIENDFRVTRKIEIKIFPMVAGKLEIWEAGPMKTTLEIPDDLFREAKARAALNGMKLKDLVAEGLRLALGTKKHLPPAARKPRPLLKSLAILPTAGSKSRSSSKLKINPARIHELEMQAELKRHEASL
jgi:hypothetical protein